jgi:hypothetical protein
MWAAMDSDGTWYWYENDPKIGVVSGLIIGWLDDGDRFEEFLASPCEDWRTSKQRRPK